MYKKNTFFIMLAMLCITAANMACGLQTTGAVSVPLLAPKPSSTTIDTKVLISNSHTNTMRVTAELLNFRTAAGEENGTVTGYPYLTFGDVVTLTGNTKTTPDLAQWVEVEFQGVTGWVNFRYLAEVK